MGDGDTLSFVVASIRFVADAIVFVVGLALARMLLPMADGMLSKPYLLLAVSGAAYMYTDVIRALPNEGVIATLVENIRYGWAISTACETAAGLVQLYMLKGDQWFHAKAPEHA